MIRFKCEYCESKNKIPNEYIGQPVKCFKCGRFTVVHNSSAKSIDKDTIEIRDEEILEEISNAPSENGIVVPKTPEKADLPLFYVPPLMRVSTL